MRLGGLQTRRLDKSVEQYRVGALQPEQIAKKDGHGALTGEVPVAAPTSIGLDDEPCHSDALARGVI